MAVKTEETKSKNDPISESLEADKSKEETEEAQTEQAEAQNKALADSKTRKEALRVASESLAKVKEEFNTVKAETEEQMKELKKLINEAEKHGISFAGRAVEKTDEEKAKEEANKLLKGTGLSIE